MPYDCDRELLVTLDLESLYTNIPQEGALMVLQEILSIEPGITNAPFIIQCLQVVLSENYFEFNNCYFQQIQGVSMGALCAPSVACLYMGHFEQINIYNEIAPFHENVRAWSRFIDDIFFIWEGIRLL